MAFVFAGTTTSVTSVLTVPPSAPPPVITDWTNAQHHHDIASQGGQIDHTNLLGLLVDDHPQYLLTNGTRTLTGNLSMGGFFLANLATPLSPQDAATKQYVDTIAGGGGPWQVSGTVINPVTGTNTVAINATTMVGAEKLRVAGDARVEGTLTVTAAPVAGTDATNKTYVDALEALDVRVDGSRSFTGAQSMGGFKLTNVAVPTVGTDAANKNYVDANAGGVDVHDIFRYSMLTTGV